MIGVWLTLGVPSGRVSKSISRRPGPTARSNAPKSAYVTGPALADECSYDLALFAGHLDGIGRGLVDGRVGAVERGTPRAAGDLVQRDFVSVPVKDDSVIAVVAVVGETCLNPSATVLSNRWLFPVPVPTPCPKGDCPQCPSISLFPIGVLMHVQVAFVLYPHHDQLINILRAVNGLLIQVPQAVPGLKSLFRIPGKCLTCYR